MRTVLRVNEGEGMAVPQGLSRPNPSAVRHPGQRCVRNLFQLGLSQQGGRGVSAQGRASHGYLTRIGRSRQRRRNGSRRRIAPSAGHQQDGGEQDYVCSGNRFGFHGQ